MFSKKQNSCEINCAFPLDKCHYITARAQINPGVPDTPRVVGRGGATERTSRIKPDTATKRSARRRGQEVLLRRRGIQSPTDQAYFTPTKP